MAIMTKLFLLSKSKRIIISATVSFCSANNALLSSFLFLSLGDTVTLPTGPLSDGVGATWEEKYVLSSHHVLLLK